MVPQLQLLLITGALSIVTGFATGYKVAQWRADSARLTETTQQLKSYADYGDKLDKTLQGVITKSEEAAAQAQQAMDSAASILAEKNQQLLVAADQTKDIQYELAKLDLTGCSVPPEYRRVQERISQTANSNRDKLYEAD